MGVIRKNWIELYDLKCDVCGKEGSAEVNVSENKQIKYSGDVNESWISIHLDGAFGSAIWCKQESRTFRSDNFCSCSKKCFMKLMEKIGFAVYFSNEIGDYLITKEELDKIEI